MTFCYPLSSESESELNRWSGKKRNEHTMYSTLLCFARIRIGDFGDSSEIFVSLSRDGRGDAIKSAKFETGKELNFWNPLSLSLSLSLSLFLLSYNSSQWLPEKKIATRVKRELAFNITFATIPFRSNLQDLSVFARMKRWSRFNADAFCRFFFSSSRCTLMGRVCLSIPGRAHTSSLVSATYSRYPIDRPTYYTSTFFFLPYSPRSSSSSSSNCSQLGLRAARAASAHARLLRLSFGAKKARFVEMDQCYNL